MQLHFEDVVLKCLEWLHQKVPVKNLISAGGCALNGVCNSRILRDTPFQNSFIQCAASDDGTAIGAALYVWHEVLKNPRGFVMHHAYYGSEASDAQIETALKNNNLPYERMERQPLLEKVAEFLNRGQIVGWFQGRSEWGPRALGNRSLLAHPGWPGMKELINQKIKRRESFRPFAPSILADEVVNYFEQTIESPFMMHVVKIKPEKRQALSAVCHADFTGRLHTVKKSQNALYYDLIQTFGRLSGTPVVLNTSFNENEPIVETPEQAIACYLRNDVDVLCMGSYVTSKLLGKPSIT
jgi:carbamoyltransferase